MLVSPYKVQSQMCETGLTSMSTSFVTTVAQDTGYPGRRMLESVMITIEHVERVPRHALHSK